MFKASSRLDVRGSSMTTVYSGWLPVGPSELYSLGENSNLGCCGSKWIQEMQLGSLMLTSIASMYLLPQLGIDQLEGIVKYWESQSWK
jgi:hypothetical protein